MPDLAIGIDPGRSSGLGLICLEDYSKLDAHTLLALSIYGTDDLWLQRATLAVQQAVTLIHAQGAQPADVPVWIEQPPVTMRKGSLAGDSHGNRTWAGLGRFIGRWEVLLWNQGFHPVLVNQDEWTKRLYPLVLKHKKGDGQHRVVEARRLVKMSENPWSNTKRDLDLAEGILIGLALATSAHHNYGA